ncbi:MAG: protein O-mannosyl-transferase family [Candidatus Kapaibacterium sp.]
MKNRENQLYTIGSLFIPLLLYIFTMAPGLTFTDSGELAGVCVTLGIAHPTGYPLFTLLGHLWSLLFGSDVFLLNIFAGVMTALSAMVFYLLSRDVLLYINMELPAKSKKGKKSDTPRPVLEANSVLLLAFASALTYAAAATIWQQGLSIEVYSLQLLVINLILWVSFRAATIAESRDRTFMLAALLLGLGFANHMTTLLILPGFAMLFFMPPVGERPSWRTKFLMIIPFVIGLSLYLYLPIRSAMLPEFNWGWVHRSLDKFMYHVSGRQYQVWMFSDASLWGDNLLKFIVLMPKQVGWIGLVGALAGIIAFWRKSQRLFWAMALLFIACVLYTMNYSIHDIDPYFSLAFIVLILFMAAGIWLFARKYPKIIHLALLIPLISFIINLDENDRSDNYLVEDYTTNLVDQLRPDAIIISSQWDYWCSAFWYKQRVEGYRPDVALVEKELLRRTWYPKQLRLWYPELMEKSEAPVGDFEKLLERFEADLPYDANRLQAAFVNMLNSFIDRNYENRPVYITLDIVQSEPDVAKDYRKVPEGFTFRLVRDHEGREVTIDNFNLKRFIESSAGGGHLEEGIRQTAAINIMNIGRYAQYTNQRETAVKAYQLALEIDPDNPEVRMSIESLSR